MSVLNPNSEDEAPECPLCMEDFELDDINFYPCACGYQICRFCWNKIRVEGNGNCPACRSPYSENPADFKPLTAEELARIKAEKRQKDQAKKQKVSESRKHLSNVRVVQRNLVFVVGLSPRLSDPDVLKKAEYFGKFGKIHKVVINQNTSYAGNQNQGPSASAYVTYYKSDDAIRAIQAVNNIFIDGRTLKASLGTTKYCSHFMKNQPCPKHDCMYLHELGDEAASFTKEEMQQGKHTDYERALHEEVTNGGGGGGTSNLNNNAPGSSGLAQRQPESGSTGETGGGGGGKGSAKGSGGASGNAGGKKSRSNSPRESKNNTGSTSGWPNLANSRQQNGTREEQSDEDSRVGSNGRVSEVPGKMVPKQQQQQAPLASPHPAPSASPPSLGSSARTTASSSLGSGTDLARPSPPLEDPARSNEDLRLRGSKEDLPAAAAAGFGMASNSAPPVDDDFDEEDDLGFDPFMETQKGFADLLESESRQQQHHQQQRRELQQQPDPLPIHPQFQPPGILIQQQQSNGRHSFLQQQSQQPLSRPKAPPPGFAGALPGLSRGGFQSNGAVGGLDGLHQQQQANHLSPTSPFSSQDLLNRMGKVSPPPGVHPSQAQPGNRHNAFCSPQQQQSGSLLPNAVSKEWEGLSGLRALLPPNVNLSFSNGGGNGYHQTEGANRLNAMRFHREDQHDRRFGNMVSGNADLSLLDPAIVSGQLSNSNGPPGILPQANMGRSDSPLNSWMRSNGIVEPNFPLDSAGPAGGGSSNGFGKSPLPTFAGLSLSGGQQQQQQARWNGVEGGHGHGGAPPPPPGFNLGRMRQQQHQSPFPNMNMGNSDVSSHHPLDKGFF